jgi:hypothetical protein
MDFMICSPVLFRVWKATTFGGVALELFRGAAVAAGED